MKGKVAMYNSHTNVLVFSTKKYVPKWEVLGFKTTKFKVLEFRKKAV